MPDYLLDRVKIGKLYDAIYTDINITSHRQYITLDIHDVNNESSVLVIQYQALLTDIGILGKQLIDESPLPSEIDRGILFLNNDASYQNLTSFQITNTYLRFKSPQKRADFIDWFILKEETRQANDIADIEQRAAPAIRIAKSNEIAMLKGARLGLIGIIVGAVITILGGYFLSNSESSISLNEAQQIWQCGLNHTSLDQCQIDSNPVKTKNIQPASAEKTSDSSQLEDLQQSKTLETHHY